MKREVRLVPTIHELLKDELGRSGMADKFTVEIGKQVTEDGYRADLCFETDDKVVVFEIKSGFGPRGVLGPEIIPSGKAIKDAVTIKYGKEARVVFVSPGGAAEYVRKGLSLTSGSPVYGADRKGLSALRQYVAGSLKGSRMRKVRSATRTSFKK